MLKTIEDITVFADGLDHPECVAVHPVDGSVWAGGEAGQVYRVSPDGKEIKEVANTGGFVLGIAFSPGAEWLAICDLRQHCIWKLNLQTYTLRQLPQQAGNRKINIPNYPVFDRRGNLYVSESGAFREISGAIYRFDTSGKAEVWHDGPFNFANGMALSKQQDELFVVCSWLPGVERIRINADGSAGERSVLVEMPQTCPDGIVLDEQGNVYISCYAPNTIYRYGTDQKLVTLVHDWEAHTLSNATNMAFGGKEHRQLYIANLGRWHIASMQMDIAGLQLV